MKKSAPAIAPQCERKNVCPEVGRSGTGEILCVRRIRTIVERPTWCPRFVSARWIRVQHVGLSSAIRHLPISAIQPAGDSEEQYSERRGVDHEREFTSQSNPRARNQVGTDVGHYALRCGSSVENTRDGWMVHERQRLTLGVEPATTCAVSFPALMTLSATWR